ncbi:hypothetical protein A2755_00370 [Candidatus Wolfebacteria bacterium RIFCSPHIGHO2_01_FULL_48_22]|uniref:Probable endonuclease 4 n=1 Tax=Candidatus Wolfebacteria bacterium RIFCSPHIGHO2_01_FULL_48_22 TaxID=1802555 RepID=A0A1F8DV93_9BACT|nr:MAG: hypothetical protein A2755_00370 [Candidatus Wolfebacteria bacterium RIFCSPHIGHO2_01_FULL_48_22]
MLIGAHVSASGGLVQAIHNAVALDINVIQIFGSSPMQWKANLPDKESAELFKKERRAKGIEKVFLHAPYLINLASEKPSIRHLSRVLLADSLKISNAIGADGVIYHSGSAGTQNIDEALSIAVEAVQRILQEVPVGTLIVENAAGAGALIGDTIDELAYMIKKISSPRFGFCLDTCHALASGMIEDFNEKNIQKLEAEIKKKIGVKKLLAIHLNDSKFPYNSKRDRHENIGKGHIGTEGFKNFFKSKLFRSAPLILEVPGFTGNGPDEKNVKILKSLI